MSKPTQPILKYLAASALVLSSCDQAAPQQTQSDAVRALDHKIESLVDKGYIELDLNKSKDPTVIADANALLLGSLEGIESLDFESGHRISLRYLGKGRRGKAPVDEVDERELRDVALQEKKQTEVADAGGAMDAFNLASGNEFRIEYSQELLASVGRHAAELGLDQGTPGIDEETKKITLEGRDDLIFSWSNNDDDRYRMYGVNAAVTNAVHRRIVDMGGCSGTLVGPRHVVTAGHCLWSRANRRWSDDFWVRAGRNGSSEAAEVFVNANNIPSGQVVWYFTPSQYRSTSGSTWGYDYGILTIPGRLGDVTGWMGRVSISGGNLDNYNIYRRGYPACNAFTSGGTPRIDEPNPCNENHLYGNSATCELGEYQAQDSSGWNRVVHHSCDASGGDSGSPLYLYYNGSASVTAVHFSSRCKTTAAAANCSGSQVDRPLAALRLTPQYRDLIGTFRQTFP